MTCEVVGTQAIYHRDVRFRIDELQAWQATIQDPIPLGVASYNMLGGSTIWMRDDAYADGAYGTVAGQPLSGSTGLLNVGEVRPRRRHLVLVPGRPSRSRRRPRGRSR